MCGDEFEVKQSFSDEPLKKCRRSECFGEIYRIIFAVSTHYKCAGFTTTDARGLTGHKRKPNIKVRMANESDG